jgi:phosphoenolpyruvate carboxykinase (ATP)
MFLKTKVHYQLPVEQLIEQTLARKEGVISNSGALVILTGRFTGRSPADKFIVRDAITRDVVDWNKFNNPISELHFLRLRQELIAYLEEQREVWVRDAAASADHQYRLNLRVITENPWSNHFAANMFLPPESNDEPEWTIIQAPGFKADPEIHGTRQENFTIVSFDHQTILIGGSGYTGEIKKSVFTVLNFLLPARHQVLSMHCSANEGAAGDTALFFGLSGTGKTTLSSDPSRTLIGDDEHGWDEKGIFNFEGGCYAKAINLSKAQEPDIYNAIRSGALVENTGFKNGSNEIDFDCSRITENTRVSYPLDFISNIKSPSMSGVPKHIFFLTCDAYGVLPPISKLAPEDALYYFLSGYTARVAGTEAGVDEPQATFSACFGAPFLPLKPACYASLLKQKLLASNSRVWLVNTGWTGGAYGTGQRIPLKYTRAMINAALCGLLEFVPYQFNSPFNLQVPLYCPGVPEATLDPVSTWTDKGAYLDTAMDLKEKFKENYERYHL